MNSILLFHAMRGWRSMNLAVKPGNKRRHHGHLVACILLLLALASPDPAAAANLLLNGSFESPVVPANTYIKATPTSWQGSNNPNMANGNIGSIWPLAEDGQQYVILGVYGNGAASAISQAFTITNAGVYQLAWFDSAAHEGVTTAPYSLTVSNGVAPAILNTNLDAYHVATGWMSNSVQLTLTAGSYTLQFYSLGFPRALAL